MKAVAPIACLLLLATTAVATERNSMKISIVLANTTVEATLNDGSASRDLYAMLPLTVWLEEYAATEKIAYLPRKLATTGAPDAFTPSVGDLSYYAPWGNLALFYRGGQHSPGLVPLGRIDSGLDQLKASAPQKVTIRRAER
jgi:hypothetical protein